MSNTSSVVFAPGPREKVLTTPSPISRSTSSALLTISAWLAVGKEISKSQVYGYDAIVEIGGAGSCVSISSSEDQSAPHRRAAWRVVMSQFEG